MILASPLASPAPPRPLRPPALRSIPSPDHPPSSPVSLEGVVERVTFESAESSFRVLKLAVRGAPSASPSSGRFPPTPVGARVRVRGRSSSDKKHGEQLRVESLIELAPDTLAGLEKYLGVGPHQGRRARSSRSASSRPSASTRSACSTRTPIASREVEGLGDKRRAGAGEAWREQRALRDVMVFLQAHGATPALATRIVQALRRRTR